MLQEGDICIVNDKAKDELVRGYRSLIGKLVVVTGEESFGKYPIQVINPDPSEPIQHSRSLRMRTDLLTQEG